MRSFGIKFGYYDPSDWELAAIIDPVIDNWSDIMVAQTNIVNAVSVSDEEKLNMIKSYITNEVLKFHLLVENRLELTQGKFIAGNRLTICDFVLLSYTANVIRNTKSPFCAVTAAIMSRNPQMLEYTETLMTEFAEILNARTKLSAL